LKKAMQRGEGAAGEEEALSPQSRRERQMTACPAQGEGEKILDIIPDLVAVIDKDHRLVRVNRAMAARMGLRPEECAGLTCYRAVHGTDSPPEFCPHRRLLEDGLEHAAEVHEEKLGGDFLVTVSPLRDPEGGLIGSIHIARDITDQKKAEQALRRTEAQYRLIAENTADVIWVLDLASRRFTYVSPSVERLRGFTAAEVMARPMEEALTPASLAFIERTLQERLRAYRQGDLTTNVWTGEVDQPHRNGSIVHTEVVTTLLTDERGEPERILGVTREITERRRAQQILEERERQYRTLVEAASRAGEAVIVTQDVGGREGVLVFANEWATTLTGYGPEDYNRLCWMDIIPEDHRPAAYDRYRRRIAGEDAPAFFEAPVITKRGDRLLVAVSASRTEFQGRPAVVSFFRDIRAQKKAEEALRRSEAEALRLARENETLAEIGQVISSSLDMRSLYGRLAAVIRKLIPFDRLAVNVLDPGGASFSIPYVLGREVKDREEGAVIPIRGTLVERVTRTRSGAIIGGDSLGDSLGRYPGLSPLVKAGLTSMLFVPLIFEGRVMGVLNLQSAAADCYSPADLKLAEKVGAQIAGAVANMELYRERKRVEEELLKSEERYRRLVELSPFMITVHRQEKFVYLNPAGRAMPSGFRTPKSWWAVRFMKSFTRSIGTWSRNGSAWSSRARPCPPSKPSGSAGMER